MSVNKNRYELADIKPEELSDLSCKIIGLSFIIDSLFESFEKHGLPDEIHEIREAVVANTTALIEQIDTYDGRGSIIIE